MNDESKLPPPLSPDRITPEEVEKRRTTGAQLADLIRTHERAGALPSEDAKYVEVLYQAISRYPDYMPTKTQLYDLQQIAIKLRGPGGPA